MHLTAPSYPAPQWSRSIGTSGRDPSERVVTIVGMRNLHLECSGSRYWPDAIADIIRRLRDGDASDLGGDAPEESGPGST
jgi:hypothetical protein